MIVRTFLDYTPIPRQDAVAWTEVEFYEAPDVDGQAGTFVLIDTQTLSPVDSNPASPATRSFTTTAGTLETAWYQVIFKDASDNTDTTDPVFFSAIASPVGLAVKAIMPLTWRALSAASYYGESMLMSRVEVALHECFPQAVAEASQSTYSPLMIEYAAKRAALEIIPAGIEYWMNQTNTISTTGTSETTSYTDRANQLRELAKWLQAEVARLSMLPGLVDSLLPPGDLPEVADNTNDYMLTSSPYDFPPAFGEQTDSSMVFGSNE